MKICFTCKRNLDESFYGKNKRSKDGLSYNCNDCRSKKVLNHRRTKFGLIARIYQHQKQSSLKRKMKMPTYTKEWLESWLMAQPKFHQLYDEWKASAFKRELRPSADRKNNSISYEKSNIQLMTWIQNKEKQDKETKAGMPVTKRIRAVKQYDLNGNFIAEYKSISIAARITGCNRNNISFVCKGKRNKVCNSIWKYA